MLLSLNWLKDYLAKTDLKIDPKELADDLTMRGLAVAAIKKPPSTLDNVLVGRIEKIEKHPNADRLQVTKVVVSDEPNAERLQIVCGAKNIGEGDIVPVALPGALLPGDFAIKVSQIRGVESKGMICSGKELGVADDSDGILQLPKHTPLGQPVARLLGGQSNQSDDTILEFELTPNRGDCLSVMGLAREIAPILKTKLRDPKPARFRNSSHRTSSIIKIEVDDPALCPRYVARVIDSLKVTDSPEWIKQRLLSVGMRPINNVVDVTNFVMMEYGQPLHAFDLRKIESGSLRVGACKAQMDFTLLNGDRVELEPGDILILDGERPVALAGIMGGADTQVEADTTSIVLESATFDPKQIRKTAKRLGIHSDSSKRFEKGCDIQAAALASERAAALLRDSFNANVYHPPIDTNEFGAKENLCALDMRDVRRVTGLRQISAETVSDLLDSIGVPSHKKSVNVLSVRLPTFRPDLREPIDLIEEVARLVGYDTVPQNSPLSSATYDRTEEGPYEFEMRARNLLAAFGLRETIHYSFNSEENFSKYGLLQENMVSLQNPISEEMKVLRTSLLPSLLESYLYNRNRGQVDQRLFEIGRTYVSDNEEETKVREQLCVSGLLSGHASPRSWFGKSEPVTFYHGKGIVESLVKQLATIRVAYEQPRHSRLFHPNRSATIKLGLREVGLVGEVHPFIRGQVLQTEEPVILFEMSLDALRKYERSAMKFKPPSKFPAVELDIAVLVDKPHPSFSLSEAIRHAGGSLLSDVSIFDVYEGEHIPSDKKSIGFRLTFSSPDRTLQDSEVLPLKENILKNLTERYGAQLRG